MTLFELARHAGGRARSWSEPDGSFDNGQHILIGAYHRTLALMSDVGVPVDRAFDRRPLALKFADGRGLEIGGGPAPLAFARALLGFRGWTWPERLVVLRHAMGWWRQGFRCAPDLTVAQLTADWPPAAKRLLIEPLCVAALNTPAREASAEVLLRVMRDALFGRPGDADALLPRWPLSRCLAEPACAWLVSHGARVRFGTRVSILQPIGDRWQVEGEEFDQAVLACPAGQAARLTARWAPAWSAMAAGLAYEPIVTVHVAAPGRRLAAPMVALMDGPEAPAQFAFDLGQLGTGEGRWAFVISGAAEWVARGAPAIAAATLSQARAALAPDGDGNPLAVRAVLAERRATFRCTPGLQRPPARIAPALVAAGDYVQGPYPATLEGAVRAGEAAVDLLRPARAVAA